jgi:hypothetical protein
MAERFFRDITDKRIRRGVFSSVPDLEAAINEYIEVAHNSKPRLPTRSKRCATNYSVSRSSPMKAGAASSNSPWR